MKNSPTANAWKRFCQTLLQWIHCRVVTQTVEPTNIPNWPDVTEEPYNSQLNKIISVLYVLFLFNLPPPPNAFFSPTNTSMSETLGRPLVSDDAVMLQTDLFEIFSETRNAKHQIQKTLELLKTIHIWSKQFWSLICDFLIVSLFSFFLWTLVKASKFISSFLNHKQRK